jgi:hypothetical protein
MACAKKRRDRKVGQGPRSHLPRRLAAEMQKLGYQIRHERGGPFELAHISRAQLADFSRRSAQIEQRLEAQGLTREAATGEQKQMLAMQTRVRKGAVDHEAVFKDWHARAREIGIDFQRREWSDEALEKLPLPRQDHCQRRLLRRDLSRQAGGTHLHQ